MKGTTRNQLLRLLRLTTALILLVAMLAACGKEDTEQTLNNLDNLEPTGTSTSEPTAEPTEEPTAPPETQPEETSVMGTVSTDLLNVRTGPSSDAAIAGQLNRNARVEILEETVVDGERWGRTEVGWIRLDYVTLDTPSEDPDETTEPTTAPEKEPDNTTTTTGTKGTITAGSLYIRKGAGSTYEAVGKYSKGDKVTILETKNNWGRTDKGWISLKYVDLDGKTTDTKEDTTTDNKEATTLVTDGKTTVLGHVVIDVDALNVRYGPGTKYDIAAKVYEDERVAYYQEKNGWVRIKNGWISLAYTEKDGADDKDDKDDATLVTDKSTKVLGYAVVNTGALNTRYGPGTDHDIKDKVYAGERLAYYQKDGKWVRTEEGWISLNYCYVEGQTGSKTGSGTITGDNLNVRKGPGTGYDSVGKLNKGDTVKILEQITVGGKTWGYTGEGWVSMDYVKLA